MKKYGYNLNPRTNLPLICLYGRGEDALTFNGANLMYDDLERALLNIPGFYEKVNRYAYNKYENENLDQVLEFWIELKKNIVLDDVGIDVKNFNELLIEELSALNQDFKWQVNSIRESNDPSLPLPQTYLYEFGSSPMVKQDSHHKNKYVYNMVPTPVKIQITT